MRLIEVKSQPQHSGAAFPGVDQRATLRAIEREPSEDGETIGMRAHRVHRKFIRVWVPHRWVDHRTFDARFIHAGERLVLRVWRLSMMRGRRALGPDMDLCID